MGGANESDGRGQVCSGLAGDGADVMEQDKRERAGQKYAKSQINGCGSSENTD
jgi:hypothetical protein